MSEMKLKADTPNDGFQVMQACRLCEQLTRRFGAVARRPPADQPWLNIDNRVDTTLGHPALPARGCALPEERKCRAWNAACASCGVTCRSE